MNTRRSSGFAVLFGAIALLVVPGNLAAQDTAGFKLNKTTIEDSVQPGQTLELSIQAENTGSNPITLRPLTRNIIGSNNGVPVYAQNIAENSEDLASWVVFDKSEMTLRPNEKQTLNFTVRFPENSRPGTHSAGLFLSQAPPDDVRQGSAVGIEIATILIFHMAGEIYEKTEIREFTSERLLYGSQRASFSVVLENSGNTFSRPQGFIDIVNTFTGKKIANIPVNVPPSSIFMNSKRTFTADWKPDSFVMGRYEAILALAVPLVDGSNQSISTVLQFWVLPMNIIAPILGGLLAFAIVFYVLIKLYIRKQLAGMRPGGRVVYREAAGISRMTAVAIALLVAVILGFIFLFLLA